MSETVSSFQYDRMVEGALRGVLRDALRVVESQGELPGEHHFYITFETTRPGVELPDRLRAQHPQDMTIVLQNQFWDLTVLDEAFEVTLSFNRKRERLRIPFAAVTAFADPHASFGLQFQADIAEDEELSDADAEDAAADWNALLADGESNESQDGARAGGDDSDEGANVIALDTFRKKS